MWKTIGVAILCTITLLGYSPARAQNFDGTWTGTTGCAAFANLPPWSIPVSLTIVQSQFRFQRNNGADDEFTEGTVSANGFVSAHGEGHRTDRPVAWKNQFSGRTSASTMRLTGTRWAGRPCYFQLSNTQPASYSLAGIEATKRAARADAEREVQAEKRAEAAPKPQPQPITAAKSEQANAETTQIEEIREATNFLLNSDIKNAEVVPRSESPAELVKFGTAWRAPEVAGAVKIFFPRSNLTGVVLISELIDSESKQCKGKFASARKSGMIDSEVYFDALARCIDSRRDRIASYYISPRPKGGFVAYMVLVQRPPQSEQQTVQVDSEEQRNVYRKAAILATASSAEQ